MFLILIIIEIQIALLDLPFQELPQFGKIELYQQSCVILSLEGFKQGDEIYLELIIDFLAASVGEEKFLSSLTLDVWENDKLEYKDETQQFITDYKYLKEDIHTFYIYYTIKLKANYKYLIFITPEFPYEKFPDEHELDPLRPSAVLLHNEHDYKGSSSVVIIIVASVFIVIGVAIIVFLLFRRIRKKRNQIEKNEKLILDAKAGDL